MHRLASETEESRGCFQESFLRDCSYKSAYWSAAYVSFCNGVTVFAVTSGVLGFLLVAKRYL